MQNPTGNLNADHLLTLHERIRNALFTGTHDLALVRQTLDEADEYVRKHFSASTAPHNRPPSLDANQKEAEKKNEQASAAREAPVEPNPAPITAGDSRPQI